MALVKSDKDLKAKLNACRRQITPKIGQLTNDPIAIRRIVSCLSVLFNLYATDSF